MGGAGGIAGGLLVGSLAQRRLQPTTCPPSPGVTRDADGRALADYSKVPREICATVLHIAQWYDYWPGSFIEAFKKYIRQKYGVSVEVKWPEYYSDEELFSWVSLGGQKFDIMFPSDYNAEILDRAGYVLNLNEDWLPNLRNLNPTHFNTQDRGLGYQRRSDPNRSLRAVPYQWGTLGIGFRTDFFAPEDVEAWGWDVFWEDRVTRTREAPTVVPGKTPMRAGTTQDISRRTTLLDSMRDVYAAVFKKMGWDEQMEKGIDPPTGILSDPDPRYVGKYQWSLNQTDPDIITQAGELLKAAKPNIFNFETAQQGPFLVQGATILAQGWQGDMMYAIQPNSSRPNPVSYVIPRQGAERWITNAVIGADSKNLWLAHEFINFFLDPEQGAAISDWNLYSTPNSAAYDLLTVWPNGWDPREDERLYPSAETLRRCEFLRDVGPETTKLYLDTWARIKA